MAPAPRPAPRGVAGWALLVLSILVAAWFGAPPGSVGPVPQVAPEAGPAAQAPRSSESPAAPVAPVALPEAPGVDPASGLPYVESAALPDEARETLARITAGGPYPFERDGVVFQNREGLLPERPRGTYREYTVPTPGLDHRGARRVVAEPRAGYYTDDHYASFRRIRGWP